MKCKDCKFTVDCNEILNLLRHGELGPWHQCHACNLIQSSNGVIFNTVTQVVSSAAGASVGKGEGEGKGKTEAEGKAEGETKGKAEGKGESFVKCTKCQGDINRDYVLLVHSDNGILWHKCDACGNIQSSNQHLVRVGKEPHADAKKMKPEPPAKLDNIDILLGKTLDSAKLLYPNIRVTSINGQGQIVHMDMQFARLNVETVNDVISRIDGYY